MTTTPFEHLSTDFWLFANQYTGNSKIDAIPMTRGEYNYIRGWVMPVGENPDDGGYVVRYGDGHVSWSPDHTFDATYVGAVDD